MGYIGRTLRSKIKNGLRNIVTEIYDGYDISSNQISPPGIDACPLPDDQGVLITLDTSGKSVRVGVYPDPKSEPGEVRFYSRDSDGNQKAELWIKNDGKHYFNSGSKEAARKDDSIESLIIDDSIFWTWITAVHAALQSTPANGVVAVPVPTSLNGKITDGTDAVLLP